jgi:sugar phosphate isomerase/epimerase
MGRPAARRPRAARQARWATTASSSPAGATTSTCAAPPTSPATPRAACELLAEHGLQLFAISNHLVGQAVCDNIDARHQAILPAPRVGRRRPRGRAPARRRGDDRHRPRRRQARPEGRQRLHRLVRSGTRSTPSRPPRRRYWQAGFDDFARRFTPILDAYAEARRALRLEVHPTEIAFDIASAERAIEALGGHPAFGFNYDPRTSATRASTTSRSCAASPTGSSTST